MNELKERDVAEPFVMEQPTNGLHYRAAPPYQPETDRRRHLPGIVGPTILIGAGAILLLNTTGLVDWDIWAVMWRLWPVILIAVGLDILIGRRSVAASALVAATMLVVMIGGAWALASGMTPEATETIAQPRNGISRADVTISPAAADLRIAAGSDGGMLVTGTVDRARGQRLVQDYQGSGGVGSYTLKTDEASGNGDLNWDLQLARDLPISLYVKSGVGRATIDLTGMQLTGLDVDTGAGQTIVTLPTQGRFSANIDAGIGEVIVRVPVGMAVRVHISTGLGNAHVPSGYIQQGDWYVSPNYDTATDRIELDISGGIGRIAVEELAAR